MIWPNVNKLKGMYYKVLVTLHNTNEEKEKKLIAYCMQHPNIVYVVNTLGIWQFEMDIEVKDTEEFRRVMREITSQFNDIISDYNALNIYEEHKFRFFEKGLF
jgi:predicted secreted protein